MTSSSSALILLVDDNKLGLSARRHLLQEMGYRTLTAPLATTAIELFNSHPVDLVITDYRMPDLSGIELIQSLRTSKPTVPMILISGFVDVLGLDEETTGADAVIMKNASEVQLLERAVERILKRKKPPSAAAGGRATLRKKLR